MDDLLNNAFIVPYFVFWYSPTEWFTMPIAVSYAGNRTDVLPTPVTSASVSAAVFASTAAMTTSESMGQIELPCTPPPPQDSLRPSLFLLLGPPPISKVDAIKKSWNGLPVFWPFSKWPPSKSGNHVFCHN